jgi:uncharacterized protein YjiS (DUF1127 family)
MSSLPEARRSAGFERPSSRDALPSNDAPVFFLHREPASNDGALGNRRDWREVPSMPSARDLYHAARAFRAYTLAEILTAIAASVARGVRRARARWQRRRESSSIRDALSELDDHTLRDLGLHRSEIGSVAAEMTGRSARDRVRSALSTSDLDR